MIAFRGLRSSARQPVLVFLFHLKTLYQRFKLLNFTLFRCNGFALGMNTLKFLLIKPYPFAQIIRVEFERQRDFPYISLVFCNRFDSFEFELRGKRAFRPTTI